MSHKDDLALAQRLMSGDEREFDSFFDEYFPRLYRFALTRLADDIDAIQDIVQSSLMNAIKSMHQYRGEAAMFTWLCQICRNEVNAYFRKNSRRVKTVPQDDDAIRPILESLEQDELEQPDKQLEGLQLRKLIQEVLDHLPSNYGNALEWKYVHGHSVTEIASRLEISELAAQSILARARKTFREVLEQISPHLTVLSR